MPPLPWETDQLLQGHPLVCANNSGCESKLRVVRATSTHFLVLRKILSSARASHKHVFEINQALSAGDYCKLMELTYILPQCVGVLLMCRGG